MFFSDSLILAEVSDGIKEESWRKTEFKTKKEFLVQEHFHHLQIDVQALSLQLVCGYAALVSYNQENFKFDEKEYRNISKNSKTLVVFFSRLKYTKKIAYIKADGEKAEIAELFTNERTQGTLGFWWCGRFAMHGWKMETLPLTVDLNKFDKVILVTPIWVFRMCPPMRDFIAKNRSILKTKNVEVVFNHFNPWLPKGAVEEITDLVPVKSVESKTTMLGHTFK